MLKTEKLIENIKLELGLPYIEVVCCQGYNTVFHCKLNDSIDNKKRLRMYSCSKVVTVVAALRLVEEGKLSLEDKVCTYLPEIKNAFVFNEKNEKITIGEKMTIYHLFTMTAGFTYDVTTQPILELIKSSEGKAELRDFIRKFIETPLAFEPGSRFQYSLCHDVLAAVIEVVTGKKFSQYVKQVIFDPLGMKNSSFDNTEKEIADLYMALNDGKVIRIENKNALLPTKMYESGGAGLISTVEDYTCFANALACKGVSKSGYRILKETTMDLLAKEQFKSISLNNGFTCIQGNEYGYGLGVRVRTIETEWGLDKGEFGWDGAAGTYIMIDPKQKISVVIGMHILNWPVVFLKKHLEIVKSIYEELFLGK